MLPDVKLDGIYERIWERAFEYQDKRDDNGHAATVVFYSQELLKLIPDCNEKIIIPAAILHDIGWSQIPKSEVMTIFSSTNKEKKLALRKQHQEIGSEIAQKILSELNYSKVDIQEIAEIISQHDTRKGFISKNEGIVRDADKLWRFSPQGFEADMRRMRLNPGQLADKWLDEMEDNDFFFSIKAKELAIHQLAQRLDELKAS